MCETNNGIIIVLCNGEYDRSVEILTKKLERGEICSVWCTGHHDENTPRHTRPSQAGDDLAQIHRTHRANRCEFLHGDVVRVG